MGGGHKMLKRARRKYRQGEQLQFIIMAAFAAFPPLMPAVSTGHTSRCRGSSNHGKGVVLR